GRESMYQLQRGQAIAPSAVPSLIYRHTPKEMSIELIQEIIDAFGYAATRARQAGFDAVEIHAAHGYLLTQFLSTLSNQRIDQYGGSFPDRARFVIEVICAVRQQVGDDFPIILRVSAEESIKNGFVVEDIEPIMPSFVNAGTDIIHASIGTHGSPGGVPSAPADYKIGFNVWRAKRLKDAGKIPVIAVGRFNDPRPAEAVIAKGEADLVAFGRQHLCDPDFLKKAQAGRYEDIRLCIACNQGCIEREMFESKSVRCTINPETGQEHIYPSSSSGTPCKVWIIGAGPAGLTAAYEANRLGHAVSLFEKENHPGGNIRYACKAPNKQVYGDWIQYLIRKVEKSGVTIQTGKPVTTQMLAEKPPDAVILATGGERIIPAIPGIDLPYVCDAWQILGEAVKPGKNVAVIGGGLIGMETATFLSARRSKVTLIEQLPNSPVPKFTSHGYSLHKRLKQDGCQIKFNSTLKQIREECIILVDDNSNESMSLTFDQIVLAVGMKPRDDLKAYLQTSNIRHFIVGDTLKVRRITEATEEGAKAAWEL
ncbi:FAD-dependent oxidoreductase, partial [Thermodesulfobacteriota bacterium]